MKTVSVDPAGEAMPPDAPGQPAAVGEDPCCPLCDGRRSTGFNWKLALKGRHGLGQYARHLTRQRPLKFGSLYGCPACGAKWYLDQRKEMMWVVPSDRLALVEEWSKRRLALPSSLIAAARRIGATPPDVYGNGRDYVRVPCEVVTTTGERLEMSVLSFQARPPIEPRTPKVRLADDIASIGPSEFALPQRVRLAATGTEERAPGFAPTTVKAPDGRLFTLNWRVDLFFVDGVKGSELVLANAPKSERPKIVGEDQEAITYFVADWFRGVERLRLRQAGRRGAG